MIVRTTNIRAQDRDFGPTPATGWGRQGVSWSVVVGQSGVRPRSRDHEAEAEKKRRYRERLRAAAA